MVVARAATWIWAKPAQRMVCISAARTMKICGRLLHFKEGCDVIVSTGQLLASPNHFGRAAGRHNMAQQSLLWWATHLILFLDICKPNCWLSMEDSKQYLTWAPLLLVSSHVHPLEAWGHLQGCKWLQLHAACNSDADLCLGLCLT